MRAGDPRQLAAMVLLITQSTIQSAQIVAADPGRRRAGRRTHPLTERIPVLMTNSTALNAARRTAELTALADGEPLDVIVIGGGITGTGIALDAASRGLRVALVEKHDLAFGTSRWSSKLVHGGLRYLATGNVGIARRSAIERGILMTRNAPHLVHAMPQLVPLLPSMGRAERALVRTGFLAGDALAHAGGHAGIDACRDRAGFRRERVVELAPTVRRDGLDGGLLAYDGQLIDDARLVAAVARTAAQHGARILTYVGRIRGHRHLGAADRPAHRRIVRRVRPRRHQCDRRVGGRDRPVAEAAAQPRDPPGLRRRDFGNPTAALTIPIPGELNRFVFAMPEQLGRVYLGLTDEDAPGPIPDVPQPTSEEINFLLDTVNTALGTTLGRDDVIGAYAGLRPLIDTGRGPHRRCVARPRRHRVAVRRHQRGRRQADRIPVYGRGRARSRRRLARLAAGACRTRNLPLVGAPANPGRDAAASTTELPASLVARYGAEAANVIAAATCERPTDPVADGIDVIRAEFEYAVTHEGALDVDDILDRRTRIGLVTPIATRC